MKITPDDRAEIIREDAVPFSLEELQKEVGGDIEMIGLTDDMVGSGRNIVMIIHEEGKLWELPYNVYATTAAQAFAYINDFIVGPVLFAVMNEDDDILPMTFAECCDLINKLHCALCEKCGSKAFVDDAYRRFQLWWMAQHGYWAADLVRSVMEYSEDMQEPDDRGDSAGMQEAFRNWEADRGFGGQIWPCKEEFLSSEFRNMPLMWEVLPERLFKDYCRSESGTPMMAVR